ncbi:hypothetical protein N781_03900 [Pontibacillus halophilus JSM 076056 = DSM 19796]|uniref:Methyltransferase domain-containing protein n=1 Tax=Pontibacillus halophilus JSM 076056 = DSM 19796 TaxID=1385510 RepID=A0A0A5GEP6_9BACI|nr:class I SAM-dependent methyltransferase [Pontibacillus halophilus]KGX91691.1 hypothetical protein N781_03900 [Pontibacillus halophilus JSM 076056 = DSM 19796]
MMDERLHERKRTFDTIVGQYDRFRPGYPERLFDRIEEYGYMLPSFHLLEIGAGTGKATEEFVRRGYESIDALELGERLSAFTAHKFASYEGVRVINQSFEEWEGRAESYDIVYSATAFHYIEPLPGYMKVARHLKPGGTCAFFWTMVELPDTPVYREIGHVYEQYAPHISKQEKPSIDEQIQLRKRLTEQSGLFQDIEVHTYDHPMTYSEEEYMGLMDTHSDHRMLPDEQKKKLYEGIRESIHRNGGMIEKPQTVVLYLARKK